VANFTCRPDYQDAANIPVFSAPRELGERPAYWTGELNFGMPFENCAIFWIFALGLNHEPISRPIISA